ncbi:MAG: formylglycine-generating enzyme family protein [Spirochaetaceae bacterium]|jgi:formylglycine-generating enzyme required for sulfatase activity|nr:formylglycine-generating enzyme family protein [Spirochaetaceae bacterium]
MGFSAKLCARGVIALALGAALFASGALDAQESAPGEDSSGSYLFLHTDFIPLAQDGETFIIGEHAQAYTALRAPAPFFMNRYETSYRLWWDVRVRAEALGYVFQNPGQEGSDGRRGRDPTKNEFMPVTEISWYDAAVWCNALSELTGRTPCYVYGGAPLRDSTEALQGDMARCLWDADGYRLPTETEWEFAARRTPGGFQRGDRASGCVDSGTEPWDVAWYNTSGAHIIGTAGAVFETPEVIPGTGNPNAMGLFDMSGNVLEYCWDWFADYTDEEPGKPSAGPPTGEARVARGGGWSEYTPFVLAGDRYSYDPNESYNYLGFRIVTSKP